MAEVVEVATTVRFRCWQVPNFANVDMPPGAKQDGVQPLPSVPVGDLDQSALDGLVAAWLGDIYSKAGKDCPWAMR